MSKSNLFNRIIRSLRQAQWLESQNLCDQNVNEAFEEMQFRQSRRKMIKNSLTVAGAVASTQLLQACESLDSRFLASTDAPVIIIGAGAAGLAAAYTLQKARVPFVIYEASGRLGGRIHSRYNFNSNKQFIEAGAELVDTNHETLIKLANELGVEIEDFATFDRGMEPELYYIGGKVYSQKDLIRAVKPLVQKTVALSKQIFTGDLEATYTSGGKNPLFVKYDRMSLQQYLQQIDFSSWAREVIQVAYVGELGMDADKISCISFIQMFDQNLGDGLSLFGESDESKRVKGGNSKLIEALMNAVDYKRTAKLEHRLIAIRQGSQSLQLTFQTPGRELEITSRKVILALPLTLLRSVEGFFKLELSPRKAQYVKNIGYGTNSKFMFSLQSRIWREASSLRPASTGAVFGDFNSQSFWETSRLQSGTSGVITNFSGGTRGKNLLSSDFYNVLADFSKLHPQAKESLTGEKFLMNWSKHPLHQGSYSCLMPGQYSEFWGTGKEPELSGQLVFAGEHVSEDFQGFMNGGYESGVNAALHFEVNTHGNIRDRNFKNKKMA